MASSNPGNPGAFGGSGNRFATWQTPTTLAALDEIEWMSTWEQFVEVCKRQRKDEKRGRR